MVEARLHWPLAEGIGAARALAVVTGEQRFAERYAELWRLADASFIDHERGSWHQELDVEGHVATTVWSGKADQYHALQAALGERDRTGAGLLAALSPPERNRPSRAVGSRARHAVNGAKTYRSAEKDGGDAEHRPGER